MDSLQFTERMAGSWAPKEFKLNTKHPLYSSQIQESETNLHRKPSEFTLTVKIKDLDQFLSSKDLEAELEGTVLSPFSGQFLKVKKGTFNLFTSPEVSPALNTAKEMHYCLYLEEIDGKRWTLFGFKEVLKEEVSKAWDETTTLYFYIWEGHLPYNYEVEKNVLGLGVLHIAVHDFIHQLTTFKTSSTTGRPHIEVIGRFMGEFSKNLWEAYAPFIFTTTSSRWNEHIIPLQTTIGVPQGEKEVYKFQTPDGLNLELNRFYKNKDSKNIVLLLHGLTTSTDMYIMPEHKNLVNFLHNNQFDDVWSLDWRGSARHTYNLSPHRYTIDDIAQNDIPAAIQKIIDLKGPDVRIHVICHCVGSLAFMCSLAAGKTKNIASVISNSVSLTPKVRWQSYLKLLFGPFFLEYIFRYPYLSPKIPYMPGPVRGKWIYWMERAIRHECKEPACHMVSFMWGWGFPAAYEHKNLAPETHRRLCDLFGGTSFHYYRHIFKMVKKAAAISFSVSPAETNYLELAKYQQHLPPILFISGKQNHIFPGSNKGTFEFLSKAGHDVSYQEFDGYGHQDVFMGKNCHVDIFPSFLNFIVKSTKNAN